VWFCLLLFDLFTNSGRRAHRRYRFFCFQLRLLVNFPWKIVLHIESLDSIFGVFFWDFFWYIRSNIFSWFSFFFIRLFAWLLLNLTFGKESFFGNFFWQLYTIQHYCSKIFKNSRKSFCALNLVKQTRPGEQDFGLFDIYFGCNTFLYDTKDFHFSQILDLKKIELFSFAKIFVWHLE